MYAAPGYLLYVHETTLLAQPFDAKQLRIIGEPFPVADQVWYRALTGRSAFSVSDSGVMVYEKGSNANSQLVWFDRNGKQLESVGVPGEFQGIDLSPDEKRVVVERNDPKTRNVDIWTFDLPRGIWSRLTFDPAWDYCPLWSPDGNRIVFGSIREGPGSLYQVVANSAGHEELLLKSRSGVMFPAQWSLDGRSIIYNQSDLKTKRDIWILPMYGDRQPIPFLQTEFYEAQGVLSPDGRWMAYVSNESGRNEVYVQPFPGTGIKWQVSTGGGVQSKWRRDGKELFYIAGDDKLMAIEVSAGADFKFSLPKALFQTRVDNGTTSRFEYAVTTDGQHFLLNTPVEEPSPSPINVVMNWTAELKR
jgi:Tol biopolymer transport system component